MSDILKSSQERSRKRRLLLAQTVRGRQFVLSSIFFFFFVNVLNFEFFFNLQLGLSSVDDLKKVLGNAEDSNNYAGISGSRQLSSAGQRDDEDGANGASSSKKTPNEIIYRDSSTFLKGTQSSNPHNDYCQHFVDTGQRPQNFIRDVGLADRFEEYPKLRELIKLKDKLIQDTASAPMYLKADLKTLDVKTLGTKFDVILIEPPLEEYARAAPAVATVGGVPRVFWNWDEILSELAETLH